MTEAQYWLSPVGEVDDFKSPILDDIVDGKTKHGPWALMSLASWHEHSGTGGRLGLGLGQRYRRQADGRWLKVEG
jgi:hypothetical protein